MFLIYYCSSLAAAAGATMNFPGPCVPGSVLGLHLWSHSKGCLTLSGGQQYPILHVRMLCLEMLSNPFPLPQLFKW